MSNYSRHIHQWTWRHSDVLRVLTNTCNWQSMRETYPQQHCTTEYLNCTWTRKDQDHTPPKILVRLSGLAAGVAGWRENTLPVYIGRKVQSKYIKIPFLTLSDIHQNYIFTSQEKICWFVFTCLNHTKLFWVIPSWSPKLSTPVGDSRNRSRRC